MSFWGLHIHQFPGLEPILTSLLKAKCNFYVYFLNLMYLNAADKLNFITTVTVARRITCVSGKFYQNHSFYVNGLVSERDGN